MLGLQRIFELVLRMRPYLLLRPASGVFGGSWNLVESVASSNLGHWYTAFFWEVVLQTWAVELIGICWVVQPRLVLGLQRAMELGQPRLGDTSNSNEFRGPCLG